MIKNSGSARRSWESDNKGYLKIIMDEIETFLHTDSYLQTVMEKVCTTRVLAGLMKKLF